MNSTGIEDKPGLQKIQESTIERSFDSTFDDSFCLRTKGMKMNETESGYQASNTFSFGEAESEEPEGSGIMRLLQAGKGSLENQFKFRILGHKVRIYDTGKTLSW